MERQGKIALGAMQALSVKTLNMIACDLCARASLEVIRGFHELNAKAFAVPEQSVFVHGFRDPFEAAAEKNRMDVIQLLLELGLTPYSKSSSIESDKEYYCDALRRSVEKIDKAASDVDREAATDVALVLFKAVRAHLPSNFALHFSLVGESKTPAAVLKEYSHSKTGKKPVDTLLMYSVSIGIPRLTDEIIDYVESTSDGRYGAREAEILLATGDIDNFARVIQYEGEVPMRVMKRIAQLSPELQSKACELVCELEVPEQFFDELGGLTATMTAEMLRFSLKKLSAAPNAKELSVLLLKAVRADNVPLMGELIAMGEALHDWSVDTAATESYSKDTPIHVCRSGGAVRLLVKHGADVNLVNPDGKTPIHAALGYEHEGTSSVLNALIEAGADLAMRCNGRTLMQLASPRSEAVKSILRSCKTTLAVEIAFDQAAEEPAPATRPIRGFSPL